MMRIAFGFRTPWPEPIGEPAGMTLVAPGLLEAHGEARIVRAVDEHVKPWRTSSRVASSVPTGSGSSVRGSPSTSSFTSCVPRSSRASSAVRIALAASKQPAVFGRIV